ncbi:MAG TPA: hypothetical protein VFT95_13055 [Micromonosporaceae bacterium]|nr:hypothetical protein [Micromonosporaceae bacterium]
MAQHQETSPAASGSRRRPEPAATGWVGWVLFAGILMLLVGSCNVLAGVVALFKEEYYLVGQNGLLVEVDYTVWGWALLLYGLALGLAGFGVIAGQTWARIVAVILVAVNALVNLGFLAAQPVWTMLIIALDVVVIYALIVHGRETRSVL